MFNLGEIMFLTIYVKYWSINQNHHFAEDINDLKVMYLKQSDESEVDMVIIPIPVSLLSVHALKVMIATSYIAHISRIQGYMKTIASPPANGPDPEMAILGYVELIQSSWRDTVKWHEAMQEHRDQ